MARGNTFHAGPLLSNLTRGSSWNALWLPLPFYQKTSREYRCLSSQFTLDQALESHRLRIFAYPGPSSFDIPAHDRAFHYSLSTQTVCECCSGSFFTDSSSRKTQLIF